MVHEWQTVCIQENTKGLIDITAYGKNILTKYLKLRKMKFTKIFQAHKRIFPTENDMNIIDILYTGSHEKRQIHASEDAGNSIYSYAIFLNVLNFSAVSEKCRRLPKTLKKIIFYSLHMLEVLLLIIL